MKKLKKHICPILMVTMVSSFFSCEPDTTCHQELGSAAQITLDAISKNEAGEQIHTTLWDSIAVIGVGNNIGMKGTNRKSIDLELRADTNLTAYLVLYHEQIDTLYIEHTPRLQFISLACGCDVYHTITDAWSSDSRVDSVAIINASVEAVVQENLRIYLHE